MLLLTSGVSDMHMHDDGDDDNAAAAHDDELLGYVIM